MCLYIYYKEVTNLFFKKIHIRIKLVLVIIFLFFLLIISKVIYIEVVDYALDKSLCVITIDEENKILIYKYFPNDVSYSGKTYESQIMVKTLCRLPRAVNIN